MTGGLRGFARLAAAAALALASCCGIARAQAQRDLSVGEASRIVAGANQLGGELLARLVPRDGSRTVLVSPYGIAAALGMLSLGAQGDAATALRARLALGSAAPGAVAEEHRGLRERLTAAPDVTLRIANAVWVRTGQGPRDGFAALLRSGFAARADAVDFTAPATVPAINAWVREATGGAIPELVDHLDASTEFVIADAVYFKGSWATPFDAARTRPAPFRLASGRQRSVPMMAGSLRVAYADAGRMHAVMLPYQGDRLAMIVATPKDPRRLRPFLRDGARRGWAALLAGLPFAERPVELALPRFRATFATDLIETLRGLGLAAAFASGADYGAMLLQAGAPSAVIHRVVLEVTEEGAEAAAATGIVGTRSAALPERPVVFHADRPFVVAIVDRETQAILFLGYVAEP